MKKLLLLLLPLLVFSCALEEEEEPFEAPSIEAVEEVKASGATSYPTTEGEAKEFLLESFAAISELMEVTPMGSRGTDTITKDLSFENEQVKIEGESVETSYYNDSQSTPSDGTHKAWSDTVSTKPKFTFKEATVDNGNNSYTINGYGSMNIYSKLSMYVTISDGELTDSTILYDVKMAMAANFSVKKDIGYGAKFSFSYSESSEVEIKKDQVSNNFESKLNSEVQSSFSDVSVDVSVYNDDNEEILTFTVPMSEIMVGM